MNDNRRTRDRAGIRVLLAGTALAVMLPWQAAQAQSCGCPPAAVASSGPVVEAEAPPPPLPQEEQPPIPAPGYLWTPGYWYWNNVDYYYVPGVWVQPPHPGLLWTPGFWAFAAGVYRFTHGYWGPHIGFYGGIPYGNGYDGVGYEGGHWTGNTFFYNRTVNNFGGVHVTNVYEKTVNRFDGPRVSYNGGPGGIGARPDAAQAAFMHAPHDAPTPPQMQHLRAASMAPARFKGADGGRPPAGDLHGPGHDTAERLPGGPEGRAGGQPGQEPRTPPAPPGHPLPHAPPAPAERPREAAPPVPRSEMPRPVHPAPPPHERPLYERPQAEPRERPREEPYREPRHEPHAEPHGEPHGHP